jgi:glycosyltransferase involved in cell wall biosynthesis
MTAPITISCPFEENAVHHLSSWAHDHGFLRHRLVPDFRLISALANAVARVPWTSGSVGRFASSARRKRQTGFPEDTRVSRLSEPIRILGGRVKSPLTGFVGNYAWKAQFDRAAAKLDLGDSELLLGMPGSCRLTFEANPTRVKIFHAIDGHPRTRNEWLTLAYSKSRAAAELSPTALIDQVEAELSLAQFVLVPSDVLRRQMLANGVPDHKIIVVPYGVDLTAFHPQADHPMPTNKRPRVVLAAQLSLRKGLPFLLDAAAGLNIDVDLVGNVFDRVALRHLPENVHLVGKQSRAELVSRLQRADAFVLPTIEDSFGLVVAEAAATGLPVITTTAGGASELLDNRHHSVIDPADVGQLRHALRDVQLLTEDRRHEISARVHDSSAENNFTNWDHYSRMAFALIDAKASEPSRDK